MDYKGVTYLPSRKCYIARIKKGGVQYFLGTYKTALDAALAYDKASFEMYKDESRLNFPVVNFVIENPDQNDEIKIALKEIKDRQEIEAYMELEKPKKIKPLEYLAQDFKWPEHSGITPPRIQELEMLRVYIGMRGGRYRKKWHNSAIVKDFFYPTLEPTWQQLERKCYELGIFCGGYTIPEAPPQPETETLKQ